MLVYSSQSSCTGHLTNSVGDMGPEEQVSSEVETPKVTLHLLEPRGCFSGGQRWAVSTSLGAGFPLSLSEAAVCCLSL